MSVLAQTVAGKFEQADILFLIAFLFGCVVLVVDVARKADIIAVLWRAAFVLALCAFWVS